MKTPFLLLAVVALVSLTSGCAISEKTQKNNAAAQAWLQANDKGTAKTNFEGVYYSPDWGAVVLKQRAGKITGAISYWNVKGIASGRNAYLLLVDDDWVGHTMVLTRRNSEVVDGSYSSHIPFSKADSTPIHLDKIVD
jgi:hypothetical protein